MVKRILAAKGVFAMVLAQLFFVAAWASIKFLGNRLPLVEIIFFRGFISLIILMPLTYYFHRTFKGKHWTNIFLRCLTGFGAMCCAFYAMVNSQIGNVVTLLNTLPIFMAFLAPLMLKEPFRQLQFVFVVIAFGGISMILKPGLNILHSVSIYALLAAFLATLSLVYTRKLRESDSVYIISFHFALFVSVVIAPLALRNFIWPTFGEWVWLLAMGTTITAAQLFLVQAFHHEKASTVAPFGYISVIGSYLIGLIFFAEVPDVWSIVGAIIIVGAGVGIMQISPPVGDGDSAPNVRT
ncbi:MAG: DMT family transporter [Pseudomonadota bacterium]